MYVHAHARKYVLTYILEWRTFKLSPADKNISDKMYCLKGTNKINARKISIFLPESLSFFKWSYI